MYEGFILRFRDASIQDSQGNKSLNKEEIPRTDGHLSHLEREFSSDFLFRVTEAAIGQLKTEFPRRKLFNEDLESLLTSRTRGAAARVTSFVPPDVPDTSEIALRENDKKVGPISREKLWGEILDHFKCNLEKLNAISLSTTAASRLSTASVNFGRQGKDTIASRANVVLFTCEHRFPTAHFLEMIVPEFEHRMSELPKALPQFVEQLVLRYRQPCEVYPTSCPVCVYNFLREEQVKLKKINVEEKPPQVWDI